MVRILGLCIARACLIEWAQRINISSMGREKGPKGGQPHIRLLPWRAAEGNIKRQACVCGDAGGLLCTPGCRGAALHTGVQRDCFAYGAISAVRACRQLRSLNLGWCGAISDGDMASVGRLTALEDLQISYTQVRRPGGWVGGQPGGRGRGLGGASMEGEGLRGRLFVAASEI